MQAAHWLDWGTGAQALVSQGRCVCPREGLWPVLTFMCRWAATGGDHNCRRAAARGWPAISDLL